MSAQGRLPKLLAFIGLVFLFLALLLGLAQTEPFRRELARVGVPLVVLRVSDLPAVLLVGLFFLGISLYLWAYGAMRQRDWAPLLGTVFFLHLGLYLSLALYAFFRSSYWQNAVLANGLDRESQMVSMITLTLLPFCAGLVLALIAAASPRTLRPLWEQHQPSREPWLLPICPRCRRLLDEFGKCPVCDQVAYRVHLVPLHQEHRETPEYPVELVFSPAQPRIRLSRYAPGKISASEGTPVIYLDPDIYATVSAPHAEIWHDDEEGIFYVRDLGSRNGTRVENERVPVDSPHPIYPGQVLTLGGHYFTFYLLDENESPERTTPILEEAFVAPDGEQPDEETHTENFPSASF